MDLSKSPALSPCTLPCSSRQVMVKGRSPGVHRDAASQSRTISSRLTDWYRASRETVMGRAGARTPRLRPGMSILRTVDVVKPDRSRPLSTSSGVADTWPLGGVRGGTASKSTSSTSCSSATKGLWLRSILLPDHRAPAGGDTEHEGKEGHDALWPRCRCLLQQRCSRRSDLQRLGRLFRSVIVRFPHMHDHTHCGSCCDRGADTRARADCYADDLASSSRARHRRHLTPRTERPDGSAQCGSRLVSRRMSDHWCRADRTTWPTPR